MHKKGGEKNTKYHLKRLRQKKIRGGSGQGKGKGLGEKWEPWGGAGGSAEGQGGIHEFGSRHKQKKGKGELKLTKSSTGQKTGKRRK